MKRPPPHPSLPFLFLLLGGCSSVQKPLSTSCVVVAIAHQACVLLELPSGVRLSLPEAHELSSRVAGHGVVGSSLSLVTKGGRTVVLTSDDVAALDRHVRGAP